VIDGRWHHVAVIFDRGAITFYNDGKPTTEPAPVSMPGAQPAGSPCQIGAGFGDATGFVGQVFDLRVWTSRARPSRSAG
jgi:Concanavalin A-like lectin/glucanases superfamily